MLLKRKILISVGRFRSAQAQVEDDVQVVADIGHDDNDATKKDEVAGADAAKKGEGSSGRLFMKKFLMFKNMFGGQQKQPIIIITGNGGAGTGTGGTTTTTTGGTNPTTQTTTTTGTVPTATGTGTTGTTGTATGGTGTGGTGAGGTGAGGTVPRIQFYGRGSVSDENKKTDNHAVKQDAALVDEDEQAVAAALAAGGEEYVVTEQEIKGTSDAKANRGPARINLKRRGAKRGQVVRVRVPAKYRKYFKNGQRVVLNRRNKTKRRPIRRRVIRRKSNRRRNKNRNNNKRRRIIAA